MLDHRSILFHKRRGFHSKDYDQVSSDLVSNYYFNDFGHSQGLTRINKPSTLKLKRKNFKCSFQTVRLVRDTFASLS